MATKMVTLTLTLGVVILLLSLPGGVKPVHCISSGDMESMLSALRARGYNLFSNAIATSDLQFDLLCAHSNANSNDNANASNDDYFFTIFAPTDAALFALDMTQTAPFFTDTLRLHVVPKRLSFSQLQRLSSANLRTLLPSRDLHVTTRHLSPPHHQHHHNRRRRVVVVSVDEIEVVFPGVYYGRYVAVHGLDGILTLRGPPQYSSSPVRSVLPQRTNICSNPNRTVPSPPPQQPPQSFIGYSPANSPSYLGVSPGLAPTIQSPESENTASPSLSIGNGCTAPSPPPQQPPQSFIGYSPANWPSYLGASPGLAPMIQSPESENTALPSPSIGNGCHDDQDQLGQLWSTGW